MVTNSLSDNFGYRLKSASRARRGNEGSLFSSSCRQADIDSTLNVEKKFSLFSRLSTLKKLKIPGYTVCFQVSCEKALLYIVLIFSNEKPLNFFPN